MDGGHGGAFARPMLVLVDEAAHQRQQAGAQIVALERPRQVGAEIAELVAGVVARAVNGEAVAAAAGLLRLREHAERVGELDLAAPAGWSSLQNVPDRRR